MSKAPQADGKLPIAPQAALNEYAAMNEFLRNRNLLLAQQLHELTATIEALQAELRAKDKGKA